MKTPTPSKAEEINLLQRLTVQAREAGAEYLHDALIALAVPFENAIRSDFPGEMALYALIDCTRDARETLKKLQIEITAATDSLRIAREDTRNSKRETERAQNELAECRAIARRLATA